jgi:hypothetical protein
VSLTGVAIILSGVPLYWWLRRGVRAAARDIPADRGGSSPEVPNQAELLSE